MAVATILVLALSSPALPVLVVGVAVVLLARVRVFATADPRVLIGLFLLAVAVGSIGRWWHGPEHLANSFDRWQTAATGAITAVCLNNLPRRCCSRRTRPPTHAPC